MTADQQDTGSPAEIAEATRRADNLAKALVTSGDAPHEEQLAYANRFRQALTTERELNGGRTIPPDSPSRTQP